MASAVVTPTPVEAPASAPVVVETPTPAPAVAPTVRESIYAKYYGNPQEPAPVATTEEPTEPTPVVEATPAVTPPSEVDSLKAALAEMQATLAAMKAAPAAAAPAPTPPASMTPAEQSDWVEALKEGRFDDAKRLVNEAALRELEPRMRNEMQQTILQSVEMVRMENTLKEFISDIRQKNADLEDFTPYITAQVEAQMSRVQASKPNLTPHEFVAEYQKAVQDEVSNARKLYQKLRGSGKEEAMTAQKTVISSAPVAPAAKPQQAAPPPAEEPTTSSYLKQRMELLAQRRGFGA